MPEKIKDEISDAPGPAHKVLEQVEAGSSRVTKGDNLSINGCLVRQFNVGELLVEWLRVARIQPDFASGLDSDYSEAIELQFPKPLRSLRQIADRQTVHRLNKTSLRFGQ